MATDFQVDVQVNVQDYGPIVREAVNKTAKGIRDQGRSDISRAGRFGRRPTRTLTTKTEKIEGGYRISVNLNPAYLKVFETGGTSVGKPLLWIPLSRALHGIRASRYPGQLFRPKGKRVLIATEDRQVKYVGIPSVTNAPRFNIRRIAEEEATKFLERMSGG